MESRTLCELDADVDVHGDGSGDFGGKGSAGGVCSGCSQQESVGMEVEDMGDMGLAINGVLLGGVLVVGGASLGREAGNEMCVGVRIEQSDGMLGVESTSVGDDRSFEIR